MAPRRGRSPALAPSGFTLIEAIVAMVIMAVAVPAMVAALRETHARRADPVQIDRARWLAAEKLEDIIADRHGTTRGYGYLVAGNYPAEGTIAGFPGFSRSVSLAETGADLVTPGSGYMRATVTVSWTGSAGARSIELATVLTEYDP